MMEYQVSAKARILIFTRKMLKRFPAQSWIETMAANEFLKRVNDLPEDVCKELLEEAHKA